MKHMKIMADYFCYPLWELGDPDYTGDVDPGSLPLHKETIQRLDHWAEVYDETLNGDDPMHSGFKTKTEEDAWDQEGVLLWKKLQQELGADYQVDFFFREHVFINLNEFERAYPGQYQEQESPYSSIVLKEKRRTYIYFQSDKYLPMHE